MCRYGIISDIHGNLHALQSALCRLGELGVDDLICLGDVVGYGPHPEACLDLVYKHCTEIVQGNHDAAIIDPDGARTFNGPARDALVWTRDRLGPLHMNAIHRMRSCVRVGDGLMCVHASPVPGPNDYVHDQRAAAVAMRGVDRPLCLVGHTHVPMIFETVELDPEVPLRSTDLLAYLPGDGAPHRLRPDRRYICNAGSVGQPRDCDPRASFAILDLEQRTFTVHRQEYDVCAAQQAAQQAGLPTILAERLAVGA